MLRLFFIAYKSYQVLEERAWLAYLSAFPKHLQYRRTWYDETKSHTALGSKASVEGADQQSLTSPWKSLNTPAKYLYADMFSCSCLFLPSFHPSSSSSLSLKKSFGPVLYFEFLVQDMMKQSSHVCWAHGLWKKSVSLKTKVILGGPRYSLGKRNGKGCFNSHMLSFCIHSRACAHWLQWSSKSLHHLNYFSCSFFFRLITPVVIIY